MAAAYVPPSPPSRITFEIKNDEDERVDEKRNRPPARAPAAPASTSRPPSANRAPPPLPVASRAYAPLPAPSLEENALKVRIIVTALILALVAFGVGASIEHIRVAVKAANTAYVFSGIFAFIALITGLYYLRPVSSSPSPISSVAPVTSAPAPSAPAPALPQVVDKVTAVRPFIEKMKKLEGNTDLRESGIIAFFPEEFTVTLKGTNVRYTLGTDYSSFIRDLQAAFDRSGQTPITFQLLGYADEIFKREDVEPTLLNTLLLYCTSQISAAVPSAAHLRPPPSADGKWGDRALPIAHATPVAHAAPVGQTPASSPSGHTSIASFLTA